VVGWEVRCGTPGLRPSFASGRLGLSGELRGPASLVGVPTAKDLSG
jgi:hypothetical protein